MALRFYNTLTRRKEVFRPLKRGTVTMYNCGPTVYDYAHIGNFRAYIFADMLRRYLEYRGLRVKQVMNITDVGHMTMDADADGRGEDKIEMKARKEKKDPWQIARFYEKAFFEDIDRLNIQRAMAYPRATECIEGMIKLIGRLIKKRHAYESAGSVYYDIGSFPAYGKLSGNTIDRLEAGAGGRVEENQEKRNSLDFSLWIHNPMHIMQWDSPWGKGYPGWHIECSVMSMKHLGETIDIHTGGEDNIFPHHECEIAQSEGATGRRFVRYWLHTRHLLVNGEKMSKSKGNFYTLRDLLDKGYDPKAIRYLLMSGHYRMRLNFTEDGLKSAGETVRRIQELVSTLRGVKGRNKRNPEVRKLVGRVRKDFGEAMDDDLNISVALAGIFDFIREMNRLVSAGIGRDDAMLAYRAMLEFDRVLGLELDKIKTAETEKLGIKDRAFMIKWEGLKPDGRIRELIEEREKLRKGRKWKEADRIRNIIREKGIVLEDMEKGVRVKKA